MKVERSAFHQYFKKIKQSVWTFPALLLVIFSLLATFEIHGSSMGIYHNLLYDSDTEDPALIYGSPRPIRSDEWRSWTPLTTLQVKTNMPTQQEMLGTGRDVSFRPEAPTKNWSTFFKPQNWSFFLFSLGQAFAIRWWLIMYLLIVGAYFFALRILPKNHNKFLSIVLSLSFAISPFFLWWYHIGLFLSMAYALLAIILCIRIYNQETIPAIKSERLTNILHVIGLVYLGASFGLIIYVPFLIPIALVSAAFLIGYLLNTKILRGLSTRKFLKRLTPILISALIVFAIISIFVSQHSQMIDTIANSVYPGERTIQSGGQRIEAILDGYLMPLLQSDFRGTHYYANQSESSNFILLLPYLLIPGFLLIWYEFKRHRKLNLPLLFIQIIALIFLFKLYIPIGDQLYRLALLDKVPHNRLLAGLGLAGFIQLLLVVKSLDGINTSVRQKIQNPVIAYGFACLSITFLFGGFVISKYPLFLNSFLLMSGLAIFFVSILVAFLLNKRVIGAIMLLVFTLGSSFKIMPLYRGVDFFENSALISTMETVSDTEDSWVVLDSMNFEAIPMAAGRDSIGGVQLYTDIEFWRQLDKEAEKEYVYNRQAHAVFLSNSLEPDPSARYNIRTTNTDLELVKGNVFKVKFSCSDFTYDNIDFVLAINEIPQKCVQLIDKVVYPKQTFFIYKIKPTR